MDPLSDVISLLEPRSYRVGGFEAGGDWSIRFDPFNGIKCYAVTAGACWLAVEGAGEPVLLEQGDCFLLPRGWPFRVASDLTLPAEDWKRHFLGSRDGELVKLNDIRGVTVLGGHFQLAGPQLEMLLGMLPPIVHLRRESERETLRWAFDRMGQELIESKPGSFLIIQQLVYMIFVQALRLHLDERNGVGWLFALSDKQVGAAIAAIHREPGRRWTVAALASKSGCRDPVSRRDLGSWSAMDRSNISRAGACCSPAAVSRAANPSAPSPARSGTNPRARSALHSSE